MKNKKTKKFFAIVGIVGLLSSMTGCSEDVLERSELLSESIKEVCNAELEREDSELKLNKFELIGADVDKSSFDFDVSFNGVSSFSDKSVGFTALNYEVPASYFEGVARDDSYDKLYDIFEKIIKECEPANVQVSPVENISDINNAFIQNEVSPFEGYNISSGLLYNLGTPTFDDNEKQITFNTKTLVELTSKKPKAGYGLGVGFDGNVGVGYSSHVSKKQETFTIEDSYTIAVDEQTYQAMKENNALVYDYVANAIKAKDSSKMQAKQISTTTVTYDNADLLDKKNISDLEEEILKQEITNGK